MNNTKTHKNIQLCSTGGEGYFGWTPCNHCGSTLGGDRFDVDVVGTNTKSNSVDVIDTISVCVDCYCKECG